MTCVYKYQLPVLGIREVVLPRGLQPLSVQLQQGVPYLWARVDPEGPTTHVLVHAVWTGRPVHPSCTQYLGTVQDDGLVYHYFSEPMELPVL